MGFFPGATSLLKGTTFINVWIFYFYFFFFGYVSKNSRGYVYCFCKMFHGVSLFKGLGLFRTLEYNGQQLAQNLWFCFVLELSGLLSTKCYIITWNFQKKTKNFIHTSNFFSTHFDAAQLVADAWKPKLWNLKAP